jgi:glycosyltransferase involved in cell wall biosynthesis
MSNEIHYGLVSIVVASYNHVKYLPKRIESLLSQTYKNIEIIIIDDCSPDNSREVLRTYLYDDRVKLIERESNGGWVKVSNQGIELSKGEYVIFANCDDFCDNSMIEELVNGIRTSNNIGVAFCCSEMIDQDDNHIGYDIQGREASFRNKCKTDTIIPSSEIYRFFLHSCVIPNLSAALIKKKCFDEIGYFSDSYKACCDWDLFFKIFEKQDAYYVSKPLNNFRQHNKTIRSTLKGIVEYEEFIRLLLIQINTGNHLNFFEKIKFRTHVMKLWIIHITNFRDKGYKNIFYHLGIVWKYDKSALLFFLPAIIFRIIELFVKFFNKAF